MQRIQRLMACVLALTLVFSLTLVVTAQDTSPSVTVQDQSIVDSSVTVDEVVAAQDGWIVIHAQTNDSIGPVIGHVAVSTGTNTDVVVEIDESVATETLYAMLHIDAGEIGTYEFPGPDGPVVVEGAPVSPPFAITAAEEMAEVTATPVAEEEVAEEEMAEEEMAEATPTPAAEDEIAEEEMADMNIVEMAMSADNLSTFAEAIQTADLADALSGDGPFTVFAPVDDAFAALPDDTWESLLADPEGALTNVLLYHVVSGAIFSSDLNDGVEVETMSGDVLTFGVGDLGVMVNDANVITADIVSSNGVIHLIDSVLIPPSVDIAEETAEATPTPAAEEEMTEEELLAEFTSSIQVRDQVLEVQDGQSVSVPELFVTENGWVVIHLDDNDAPGAVIGQTYLEAGPHYNVVVELSEELTEDTSLWAMLHVDAGEARTYEFPGADVPVTLDGEVVMAPFTALVPTVLVSDQEVTEGTVTVEGVAAASDGWLVIHRSNAEGNPGEVTGHAPIAPGVTPNVTVELTGDVGEGEQLWAMLHYDLGAKGEYEFPGADGPVTLAGNVVMTSFIANPGMAAESDAMADDDVADDDVADEEAMADDDMMEAEAPDMLPVTGGSLQENSSALPWMAAIITLILTGGVALFRRRMT